MIEILQSNQLTDTSNLPLFFTKEWLSYTVAEGGVFFYFQFLDGTLIPFVTRKRYFTRIGLLVYKPFRKDKMLNADEESFCIQEMISYIRKHKICDVILPPMHVCVLKKEVPQASNYKLGLILVDINKSQEDVFAQFSKTYRTQIRSCERDGFTISHSLEHFDFFFRMYRINQEKNKKYPGQASHIKGILDKMPDQSKLFTVINAGGEPEGSILLIFDRDKGYYLMGAKHEEKPTHNGSQKFLQWSVMRFCQEMGCAQYNLGGFRYNLDEQDKLSNIQDFKLKFGAFVEEGYHFCLKISWKYSLYEKLIVLKQKIK